MHMLQHFSKAPIM